MLSKFYSRSLLRLSSKQIQNFSKFRQAIYGLVDKDDPSNPLYVRSTFPSNLPLENHKVHPIQSKPAQWEVTKLSNGIRVLTESETIPSAINLGILIDVGTREETSDTSGSLLSIKNTYYKTVINTNETVNYGMVQMSGGNFEMDYNQEISYFKAHCLAHDVIDIFNMMADCAVEPRSVVAANVAMEKNKCSFAIEDKLKSGEEFNNSLFRTCYGLQGLGMPLKGLRGNIPNLSAYTIQKFQLENINPNKIIVCATGVQNHIEFVDLVSQKLGSIPGVEGSVVNQRSKSVFKGGEVRNLTDSNDVHLALAWESTSWNSADFYALKVLEKIIGTTSNEQNSRVNQNLQGKLHYLDSAECLNFTFSDSGLFGLKISGTGNHINDLFTQSINEMKQLTKEIKPDELNRAKKLLKNEVNVALERSSDRLEEGAKNLNTFGKVVFNDYGSNIDKVSVEQLKKLVAGLLQKKFTLVAEGGEVNQLISYDKMLNAMKL